MRASMQTQLAVTLQCVVTRARERCFEEVVGVKSMSSLWGLCIVLALFTGSSRAQLTQCLRPPGCYLDECCFNIVERFGPRCAHIDGCKQRFKPLCCRNTRVVSTKYGNIYGYAILLDDMYEFRDVGIRYMNAFLGVPYARPPLKEYNLRFRPPQEPEYTERWDATYYRPSCPQPKKHLSGLLHPETSEDCLYMNIFVANTTIDFAKRLYPIMVFLHGGKHTYGSAALYPGHLLAQHNIMVITVQSRLNAFGFLSFEDKESPGNYGLLDQVQALTYIQENIKRFRGDPRNVTLIGHGSGAADAALHMMSRLSGLRSPSPLFHRAVWMSGSDLMEGGFVKHKGEATRYARELAIRVGCSSTEKSAVLSCLSRRTAQDLAEAAAVADVHERGWLGRPWSPVNDGYFIDGTPEELRKAGKFARIRVIGGLVTDDGSEYVRDEPDIAKTHGISMDRFRKRCRKIADDVFSLDVESVADSIEFEYTWWPDPKNDTYRLKMLRDIYSDWNYGSGLNRALQYQADVGPIPKAPNITQMYVFKYKSAKDPRTKYLGAFHGSELDYLFGLTYLNDSQRAELGLSPVHFKYEELDKNMSDYFMHMLANFVQQGNATPVVVRNLTWDTFRPDNRTYLQLNLVHEYDVLEDPPEYDFHLLQNYRVYHFAFWRYFFPKIIGRLPRYSTPMPTPMYIENYKVSSFTIGGLTIVVFVVILGLTIVYCRRRALLR